MSEGARLLDDLICDRDRRLKERRRQRIRVCQVPEPMPEREVPVFDKLIEVHCDAGHTSHERCVGSITIDRAGVTLQCPRCGDVRKTWPKGDADG